MEQDQQTYELIDSYLRNELKAEDMDKVRYRIRTEPDFALRVELHEALIGEIRESREADLRKLLKEHGKVNYIQNLWSTPWLYASAAIVAGFLILFVVLKYYIPQPENPLVLQEDGMAEQPLPDDDEDSLKTTEGRDQSAQTETDSTTAELTDSLSDQDRLVEEGEEEEPEEDVVNENKANNSKVKSSDLTSLRKESDKIQADEDVQVKRDRLLESRVVKVQQKSAQLAATESETTIASDKKQRKIFKKEKEQPSSETGIEPTSTPSETTLKLELWESPVNFKGYMWDKETLLLYEIPASDPLQFRELNGQIYMLWRNKYYLLKRSAKYEGYTPVTDPNTIQSLE